MNVHQHLGVNLHITVLYILQSYWPIARHRTVSARHHTLLVYEGNLSHVIKNRAGCSVHKGSFSRTVTVHFDHVTSYFILCPLLYGVALSDSVQIQDIKIYSD